MFNIFGSCSPPGQQEAVWDGGEKPGNCTGEANETRGFAGKNSALGALICLWCPQDKMCHSSYMIQEGAYEFEWCITHRAWTNNLFGSGPELQNNSCSSQLPRNCKSQQATCHFYADTACECWIGKNMLYCKKNAILQIFVLYFKKKECEKTCHFTKLYCFFI